MRNHKVLLTYGINDRERHIVLLQRFGNDCYCAGLRQHACVESAEEHELDVIDQPTSLDHIHANVSHTSIYLLLHKLRRNLVNVLYSLSVLGRQGCRCGHGIAAMSCDDLLVGLETTGTDQSYMLQRLEKNIRSTGAV